jgi:hypothetical protein
MLKFANESSKRKEIPHPNTLIFFPARPDDRVFFLLFFLACIAG